ncbi:DUF4136 domain-containing protein [Halotalea alkalilenta]|uniref:DUF4136 domain-containing protein n=1 Tax=Halotalea alkalilenta TaxID=376489 RepID=A0A172YDI7_9GAMM|nr:DUF4136 domain-containing protein [Halotalea alkalilenta]ANF57307.1 hypothetical protein A5892_07380 [Halotalea alkalilenta]
MNTVMHSLIKRTLRGASVFAMLLVLGACSSVATQRDFDPNRNFASYHSWSWMDPAVTFTPDNPLTRSDLTRQRIDQALQQQLPAKGLLPAAAGTQPDMRIQASVAEIKRPVQTETLYDYYYGGWGPYGARGRYGPWGGPWGGPAYYRSQVSYYSSTLLQIDMYDGRDGQLIWRGRTEKGLGRLDNPDQRAQAIAELLADVLTEYPPVPR